MGSRVLYELDYWYRKPVLYVIPIQSILGKLAVVPVGDTGTIPGGVGSGELGGVRGALREEGLEVARAGVGGVLGVC